MINENYRTSKSERISYGVYFIGQLIFYTLIGGFLQLYMTDIGISATVVGAIFFIAKIWDAINDPMFGIIVDKTNLKSGKFIPWIRLSTFLIPVTSILLFSAPMNVSVQVKAIWIAIAYLLWDTSYTICDVPIFAIVTSMTDQIEERDRIYLLNRFFVIIGGIIVIVAVPLLYPTIGWTMTAVILAVIGIATMLPVGFKAKERFHTDVEKNPSLKQLARYLWTNKPLLIFNLAAVIASLTNTASAVQSYMAIYCLGDAKYISVLGILAILPMLVAVPIVQQMIKKIEKRTIMLSFTAVALLLGILQYFIGYDNLVIYFAIGVVRAFLTSGAGILGVMFTADCAEYGDFKTGDRAQGLAFSLQTFAAKITLALSGAIGMTLLGIFGFVEGAGAVQSAETIHRIWQMSTLFPAISGAVSLLIILFFYRLRSKDVAVMMKYNSGDITMEEAQAQFSQPY